MDIRPTLLTKMLPLNLGRPLVILIGICLTGPIHATQESAVQTKLVEAAQDLLEAAQISYVYGGHKIGKQSECEQCNDCLGKKNPAPKLRFKECSACLGCSLDCSHFVHQVYGAAGIRYPYLTTDTMRQTPKQVLRRRYGFIDLERHVDRVEVGDLLVYKGHVVMLEKKLAGGKGNIVHATGGRDIKGPGNGIQRERFVDLAHFRGPLLRVLRHEKMYQLNLHKKATKRRPISKKSPK